MATIYIGKGKKDKVSKGDIVGYLCKIGQLNSSEIGKIDVKDRYAYVAVSRTKLKQVLKLTAGQKSKVSELLWKRLYNLISFALIFAY